MFLTEYSSPYTLYHFPRAASHVTPRSGLAGLAVDGLCLLPMEQASWHERAKTASRTLLGAWCWQWAGAPQLSCRWPPSLWNLSGAKCPGFLYLVAGFWKQNQKLQGLLRPRLQNSPTTFSRSKQVRGSVQVQSMGKQTPPLG